MKNYLLVTNLMFNRN